MNHKTLHFIVPDLIDGEFPSDIILNRAAQLLEGFSSRDPGGCWGENVPAVKGRGNLAELLLLNSENPQIRAGNGGEYAVVGKNI